MRTKWTTVYVNPAHTGEDYDPADFYKVGPMLYPKPATEDLLTSVFTRNAPWAGHLVYMREGNWYNEQYHDPDAKYWKSWEEILESGRSYLVGSSFPMDRYIKRHRSPLNGWQKIAFDLALANPSKTIVLINDANEWHVNAVGPEMVQFGLPYHGQGGERHYISKNGRSKVCINID